MRKKVINLINQTIDQSLTAYLQTMSSNLAIRSAREVFNIAIANKDAEAIFNLFAPTYHLITGRSVQYHGAKEESARWAALFRDDPTAVYRRSPRKITINEAWGIAEELGKWEGNYTTEEFSVHASGVYSAKWQRTEHGKWVLQAEVFTTLSCRGSQDGCLKPEPIYK